MTDLTDWGKYAPAIERHEQIAGRPAPAPTDGEGRLNPAFVEHMMLYPEGWVEGISRSGQLKALGNAIVPLQAAVAWGSLLGIDVDRQAGRQAGRTLLPTPTVDNHRESGHCRDWGSDLTHALMCQVCSPRPGPRMPTELDTTEPEALTCELS